MAALLVPAGGKRIQELLGRRAAEGGEEAPSWSWPRRPAGWSSGGGCPRPGRRQEPGSAVDDGREEGEGCMEEIRRLGDAGELDDQGHGRGRTRKRRRRRARGRCRSPWEATRRRAEELRPLEGRGRRRGLEVAARGRARRGGEGSGLERGRDREGDSGEEGGRACEGEMGSGTRVRSREGGGRARVSWRRRERDGVGAR